MFRPMWLPLSLSGLVGGAFLSPTHFFNKHIESVESTNHHWDFHHWFLHLQMNTSVFITRITIEIFYFHLYTRQMSLKGILL